MGDALYIVMRRGHEWGIMLTGENYGPYPTERDAVNAAIEAADSAGDMGYASRVVVLGNGGQFRTAWTYAQEKRAAAE
jgi:hypothetical protein